MYTDCYCTQFRRASNALTRIYDAALRPAGLRITQFSLLRSLMRLGDSTSTEVAEELSLDRTTISRNVKLLVEAGWVDVLDADDRRERRLRINAAGRKAIKAALPYFETAQKTVERRTREMKQLRDDGALIRALESLQTIAPQTA